MWIESVCESVLKCTVCHTSKRINWKKGRKTDSSSLGLLNMKSEASRKVRRDEDKGGGDSTVFSPRSLEPRSMRRSSVEVLFSITSTSQDWPINQRLLLINRIIINTSGLTNSITAILEILRCIKSAQKPRDRVQLISKWLHDPQWKMSACSNLERA